MSVLLVHFATINSKEPGLHILLVVSSVVGSSVAAGIGVAAIACVAVPRQNTTVLEHIA